MVVLAIWETILRSAVVKKSSLRGGVVMFAARLAIFNGTAPGEDHNILPILMMMMNSSTNADRNGGGGTSEFCPLVVVAVTPDSFS